MARTLLAAVVVALAAGGVAPASGAQTPILLSASAVNRHVVVKVAVGDLRPTELLTAKGRSVTPDGAFVLKNVRLREPIHLPPSAHGVADWTSSGTLHPGTYFVEVMAVATGGITDCPPKQRNCSKHWSNVRRVVVRASS